MLHLLVGALAIFATTAAAPAYCGETQRPIPPLGEAAAAEFERAGVALRAVHVVVRHGARTPLKPCGAYLNASSPLARAPWDCGVAFVELATPAETAAAPGEPLAFHTAYDGGENTFGGTCASGQLLDEGFAQHARNGAYLRDAYAGRLPRAASGESV